MNEDDRILCGRACAGDLSAASELLARHYQRIFAYFRRLCGNEHDAADLTQKTFSKAWSSLRSFGNRSAFSTWAHGIAWHVYLDWRRKRGNGELQSDEWWEARATDSPGPFDKTAEHECARQLYRWVDQLDDDKKQAVHLHYYQGLSLNETAEALGIATSTVKYRLREALDFLRGKAIEPGMVSERNTR
jgi:RNA polymerase sigma-70 factor, ECF subfamily